jgi:hypothetical protein
MGILFSFAGILWKKTYNKQGRLSLSYPWTNASYLPLETVPGGKNSLNMDNAKPRFNRDGCNIVPR